jgi:hypothetical protein
LRGKFTNAVDFTNVDREALIFLHIPKTAGTTLSRIIEGQYNPVSVFTTDPPWDSRHIRPIREIPRATPPPVTASAGAYRREEIRKCLLIARWRFLRAAQKIHRILGHASGQAALQEASFVIHGFNYLFTYYYYSGNLWRREWTPTPVGVSISHLVLRKRRNEVLQKAEGDSARQIASQNLIAVRALKKALHKKGLNKCADAGVQHRRRVLRVEDS